MRAKVAKRLKREVYGGDFSPKVRDYRRLARTGSIVDVGLRAKYQKSKQEYLHA